MASFSDFYDDIVPYLPDCPINVVDHAIRRALNEFCELTYLWWEDTTAAFSAGGDFIVATTPDITEVNIVAVFYVNGVDSSGSEYPLYPQTSAQNTQLAFASSIGQSRYFFVHPNIVRLKPVPDTLPASLVLRVAYAYTNKSAYTTVIDEIYDRYAQVIADGALSKLMMVPKKPYTDLQQARQHRQDYKRGLLMARSHTMRMNTHAELMVELPPSSYGRYQQAVYQ